MVDTRLVKYIKECLAKNVGEKVIRGNLLKQGWPIAAIDEAFNFVNLGGNLSVKVVPRKNVAPVARKPLVNPVSNLRRPAFMPPVKSTIPANPLPSNPTLPAKQSIPLGMPNFPGDNPQFQQPPKSNNNAWLFVLGILGLVVAFIVVFFLLKTEPLVLSESDLSFGISEKLEKGSLVEMSLDDSDYLLKIEDADDFSAKISFKEEKIRDSINVGDKNRYDLNKDGSPDLEIQLTTIEDKILTFLFKKISYEELGSDEDCEIFWECSSWGECINGIQERDCDDINNCGSEDGKPATERECVDESDNSTGDDSVEEEEPEEINFTDCGEDFECFVEASEACNPAEVTYEGSFEELGVVNTYTTFMQIHGVQNQKCVSFLRVIGISLEYSEALTEALLNDSEDPLTEEEIEDQEQEANETAQEIVGLEFDCNFETEDLFEMLTDWNEGDFLLEDLERTECVEG